MKSIKYDKEEFLALEKEVLGVYTVLHRYRQ